MKALIYTIVFLATCMIFPLMGVIMGAFCGWVVGTFWPSTMLQGMTAIGMGAMAPYQFGAFLGFSGGFFKAVSLSSKS